MKSKRGPPKKPVALRKLFRSVARKRKHWKDISQTELDLMLLNKRLSKNRYLRSFRPHSHTEE